MQSVWLVGGFAASPWLFSQLQERLTPFGVNVNRPDTQTQVPSLFTLTHANMVRLIQFEGSCRRRCWLLRGPPRLRAHEQVPIRRYAHVVEHYIMY